jgi:acyl carrier protein
MEPILSPENHQRLKELFIRYFELESNTQVEDISQETLEDWTSVRHLGLVMEIEAEFGVRFIIDEVTEMQSFRDVGSYLQSKLDSP